MAEKIKFAYNPDGSFDWSKTKLPIIDLSKAVIVDVPPSEKDRRRLMEYKIKIGEIKPEDSKNFENYEK